MDRETGVLVSDHDLHASKAAAFEAEREGAARPLAAFT
jgi:hypothetical protein